MSDVAERPALLPADADPWPPEPRLRLSWTRLLVLLGVVGGLVAGGAWAVRREEAPATAVAKSWGVPYVDVTLTPAYPFQDPTSNPARSVALAFVVADRDEPCTPSWGAAYTLDEAARTLELDRRIAQLRSVGGDLVLSVGGQANTELAVACTDADDLAAAYRTVVDRYDVDELDVDVEGAALADDAATDRRAAALAAVQESRASSGTPLSVWLTLPVTPAGLTAEGERVVERTIAGGVELRGVNVMTMDYGGSKDGVGTGRQMLALARSAVEATAGQLRAVYARQGVTLTQAQAYAHLGATPMIGQNDVQDEVFTLEDAQGLAAWAAEEGLGRLSMWSINRDAPCGPAFADVVVHSNTCSGVDAPPLAFSRVLAGLPGRAPSAPRTRSIVVPDAPLEPDDPATSPYPVWRPDAQYPERYKVVRLGQVYQARWYTQGFDPAAPATSDVQNPWTHVGPVVRTDRAPQPVPTVAGVTQTWLPSVQYRAGQRVLFEGLPYEARWVTQGDAPQTLYPVDVDSPWTPLFTIPGEPATP